MVHNTSSLKDARSKPRESYSGQSHHLLQGERMKRTVGTLLNWLKQFPEESTVIMNTSIYGDDAEILIVVPGRVVPETVHNSCEEIPKFHEGCMGNRKP